MIELLAKIGVVFIAVTCIACAVGLGVSRAESEIANWRQRRAKK